MRTHRDNGRLVLEAVSIPSPNNFRAERHDGRLVLTFLNATPSIPPKIVNCKFLNTLILNDNRLSGSLPYELGWLDRLKKLSVANNDLTGTIPPDLSKFEKDDFDGNGGLCGKPLGSKYGGLSSKSLGIIIVADAVGAAGSLILGLGIWWWFFVRAGRKKAKLW
ncbi:hypothetical protein C1H46_023320 [Malus baccata]|uniref:FAF domain-containing protein n=1 Tax=Malus baccata TaxID=106549 RepID=A0A540LXH6_MALBA|nr:hypothetical protein C1H46_023320 [Malus baccata]